MKTKTPSYIIIALITLLLAVSLAYAAFANLLNITGTATATGDFNITFTDVNPSSIASIGNAGKTLTVNAELAHPGDTITLTPEVTNNGSIDAKITDVRILQSSGGAAYNNNDITVVVDSVDNYELDAGENHSFNVVITWSPSATNVTAGTRVDFVIELDYEQNT